MLEYLLFTKVQQGSSKLCLNLAYQKTEKIKNTALSIANNPRWLSQFLPSRIRMYTFYIPSKVNANKARILIPTDCSQSLPVIHLLPDKGDNCSNCKEPVTGMQPEKQGQISSISLPEIEPWQSHKLVSDQAPMFVSKREENKNSGFDNKVGECKQKRKKVLKL